MTIPQGHSHRATFGATPSTLVASTAMISCGWRFALNEAADLVLALLGLLILAPLLLAIALGVRLSPTGPVIFRQRRVGRGGATFVLFKFRTMVEDSGAASFTPAQAPRPAGSRERTAARSRTLAAGDFFGRVPTVSQRAKWRDEPNRTPTGAPRVLRAVRRGGPWLQRASPRQVRRHGLGSGKRVAATDLDRRSCRARQLRRRELVARSGSSDLGADGR